MLNVLYHTYMYVCMYVCMYVHKQHWIAYHTILSIFVIYIIIIYNNTMNGINTYIL